MSDPRSNKVSIDNGKATLSVDLLGGAIVDFHLAANPVNPLSFRMSAENMPDNNKPGAVYQGHFICLGRWGPPGAGEIRAGLPDHGQATNLLWENKTLVRNNELSMQVNTPLEGLHLDRTRRLDDTAAVFAVTESVRNVNVLGRLFNIVQHPTLAEPFLTERTIVNCNAGRGFNHKLSIEPLAHAAAWPFGTMENLARINLSELNCAYSSVFSFAIKKDAKFGWITAYSPENKLLIGYLWKRSDYAWINMWQDFNGDRIRYRGLEFGTTGMHKPYKDMIDEGNYKVFDEDSFIYMDAGEMQTRSYLGFMCETPAGYTGTEDIYITGEQMIIKGAEGKKEIIIETSLKI